MSVEFHILTESISKWYSFNFFIQFWWSCIEGGRFIGIHFTWRTYLWRIDKEKRWNKYDKI